MKKILIYLLLAVMAFSFVACQSNNPPAEEKTVYTFTSGTTKIAIDDDVAPILTALGAWRDYAESGSCAFEGLDKVYTYAGFEIQTYPMNDKDFVYVIVLCDDTVATEEGVRIGDTKETVTKVYGTPDEETVKAITYYQKGMYLQFQLRDGVVTSIQYCKEY